MKQITNVNIKDHTHGIILVYSDYYKEYHTSIEDCPIDNHQLVNMLEDNQYNELYDCRAFYNGDVPDEYEYMFTNVQKLF